MDKTLRTANNERIQEVIRELSRANELDNRIRFNVEKRRAELIREFGETKAHSIMERAMSPHTGQTIKTKSPTAADRHRDNRKTTKASMRSRRR